MGDAKRKKDRRLDKQAEEAITSNAEDKELTDGKKEEVETREDVKLKKKQALNKVIRYVIYAFSALIAVLGVLYLVNLFMQEDKFDFRTKAEGIYFFPADYNENPADDPAYMAKDRDVWFSDDRGVGVPLPATIASENTIKGLMYRYFQSLKEGNAAAHAALLSKNYNEKYVVQDKFTCQKVHDIRISFNQGETRDGVAYWHYRVSYEIYENNGTYRGDIGSETARVMNFEIVYEDNVYKINSIGYITAKNNDDGASAENKD